MPGPFYFAWTGPNVTFNAAVHNVEDEKVFSVVIEHNEGEFPSLKIDVKNPKVGLLSPLRNVWCWLSWFNGTTIQPIFRGRLVGVPSDLQGEVVTLEFLAQPLDYVAQRAAIVETLKVLPFFDPVWIDPASVDDPDTVLEGYTALWHIDRVTLEVSVSDILQGEDGQLDVLASEHFYSDMSVSYGSSPLTDIVVTGTVTWKQEGSGTINLTRDMVKAFGNAGSGLGRSGNLISSMTADGLLSDWPAAGDDIGGGWSVGGATLAQLATWMEPRTLGIRFVSLNEVATTVAQNPVQSNPSQIFGATPFSIYKNAVEQNVIQKSYTLPPKEVQTDPPPPTYTDWAVAYSLGVIAITFTADWNASRDWSETVQFTLTADVQPILTDPGSDASDEITLTSAAVSEAIDPGGAVPIGDLRRNSYFKTDRGQQSVAYLVNLARTRMVYRARMVDIKFVTRWEKALDLSCRWNVRLYDDRLPGGGAVGKIKSLSLTASDSGGQFGTVTIGCAVGNGNTISPDTGSESYVEDDYVNTGYQVFIDGFIDVASGVVQFESLDNFVIIDDGIDLFNVNPATSLISIDVTNGPTAQRAAIDTSLGLPSPDPSTALKNAATKVTVNLKSLQGGSFLSTFNIGVSQLMIAKTIDLEAES